MQICHKVSAQLTTQAESPAVVLQLHMQGSTTECSSDISSGDRAGLCHLCSQLAAALGHDSQHSPCSHCCKAPELAKSAVPGPALSCWCCCGHKADGMGAYFWDVRLPVLLSCHPCQQAGSSCQHANCMHAHYSQASANSTSAVFKAVAKACRHAYVIAGINCNRLHVKDVCPGNSSTTSFAAAPQAWQHVCVQMSRAHLHYSPR